MKAVDKIMSSSSEESSSRKSSSCMETISVPSPIDEDSDHHSTGLVFMYCCLLVQNSIFLHNLDQATVIQSVTKAYPVPT